MDFEQKSPQISDREDLLHLHDPVVIYKLDDLWKLGIDV
jgi:hypothetical protein